MLPGNLELEALLKWGFFLPFCGGEERGGIGQ